MSDTRFHVAAAFGGILLLACFVRAHDSARAPERLIQELAAAAKSGDTDAFLSHLTAESRKAVDQSLETKAALRAARQEFGEALDARFGKGQPAPMSQPKDFESVLRRIRSFELVSKQSGPNGTVDLRVKTTLNIEGFKTRVSEHTFVAREEGGVWKLELNPNERIDITKEKTALNRVMADVRNGQFKDRESALLALNQVRHQESANSQIEDRGAAFGEKSASRFKRIPIAPSSPSSSIAVSSSKSASPK